MEGGEGIGGDHGDPRTNPHPKILQNENPAIMNNVFQNGVLLVQNYGWFIVLGVLLVLYLKHKFGSKVQAVTEKMAQMKKNDNYDPDQIRERQEAMEAHRRRMQEQYDKQAAVYAEQQAKKEEEKRKAKIEDWDNHVQGKGYRSKVYKPEESPLPSATSPGSTSTDSTAPRPRNVYRQTDFNPLMGGGSTGGGFRPPRRSGGTRGGG